MGERFVRARAALHRAPKGIRVAAALLCILAGIVGILIPIIPGWPLFFIGVPLLLSASPGLDRAWRRFLDRHPRVRRRLARFGRPARSSSIEN